MESVATQRFPHAPAGVGETYNIIGELVTFKVTNAETNGAFSVMEIVGQPGGGPPPHTHASAETFAILEGEFEFAGIEGGQPYTLRAQAGATVFIPAGEVHTYKVVGSTAGKAILVFAPGIDMERFFAEAGTPVTSGMATPSDPPDIPAMMAIARKHGLVFLVP